MRLIGMCGPQAPASALGGWSIDSRKRHVPFSGRSKRRNRCWRRGMTVKVRLPVCWKSANA